ncbi:MAG: transglutaminase family protein [Planctomycetota bacterium]|nr:transglutaminase family protein [Planctomycetota bacterium]
MSIRVAVRHETRYDYDRLVTLSPHIFRLRPAAHSRTPILAYSFKLKPEKHFLNWQQDPFGNFQARAVFSQPTTELSIEVELIAEMTVINPFDFFIEEYAEKFPFKYDEQLSKELVPFLEITENGPLLKEYLARVDVSKMNTNDFLVKVNQQLCNEIKYSLRMDPGIQTCEETLGGALGSCRDTAWLLVQILRHLGLAARFVSGYLIQLTSDEKSLDGPSGPEKDFNDLHAWTEVYLPGAGWIGLDPTSGLFAGEGHIPLAGTPDPASAAPVTGSMDKCEVEFYFKNTVARIHEDPRVTKPYSDAQWQAIQVVGKKTDEQLKAEDVRLTMGGEPTFVSIDDMDGAEWNTAADGPLKRKLSSALIRRLRNEFAPGGLLQFGQGKWYPGEPLPRWKLACYWRRDGQSIWQNDALLADETLDCGYGSDEAGRFTNLLARVLGANANHVVPGYEDAFYFAWLEENLPQNLDPFKANLKDPLERQKLARVLRGGLDEPVGFVLPLAWDFEASGWCSSPWEFRRGPMFLIPGDSPMGLRLPLDSLPHVAKEKKKVQHERDPLEPRTPLGDFHGEVARRFGLLEVEESQSPEIQQQDPADGESVEPVEVIRTALCIEPREGRLYIFLPPITHIEHFLDLIVSIEKTAEALGLSVVIEGYEPPKDWRLERLLVTPDPGVIEVNIHPASTWEELVHNTTTLYEQARLARLGTEKFMLDGRHTGTGGGNHVTLGGPTPADSPMLRYPELLRSLVTYWQHHPGLSYLFSGMFVGPTSQAPRVDEGREETLYELETAFQQMPVGESKQPWLVDRLLRNLLIDLTGNTHRAEFCIDKLYSPDSASGRLGLVEFRGFEMPPHARMSLVQMLLIRSLVAWFWRAPYRHDLVRWGTELHDRFMLPYYVRADMKDVVNDLRNAGFQFDLSWFDPFFEFRFPHYGTVQIDDIKLELRFAIEPWNVLGEEVTSTGTARFVDSSVERLQVKVNGTADSRYVVTCNRRRLILSSTGTHGEYVGGVRYRAWHPPSALHPTIGVHTPLIFDVIDTWNSRSIGGCTYHVIHPGGRHYETLPVNANEAESRRFARFWDYGHTQGTYQPPPEPRRQGKFVPQGNPVGPADPPVEEENPEFPHTLDLRRMPG